MIKDKVFFIYAGAAMGLMAIGLITLSALGVRVLPQSQYDRCVQLCPYPKAPLLTGRAGEDFDAIADHAAETSVAIACLEDCAQKFKKHRRQKAADGGAAPDPAKEDVTTAALTKHLPWNPDGKNVISAPTGLQHIVLREGPEGGRKPAATDRVRVHYEGRLATGEKFDSSFDRGEPASFRLNQVIPGWTMGLQEMSEGDEYLFYIPSALAYGDQPRGDVIKAGDDLVFLVQLLGIEVPKVADAAAWQKYFPWNPDAPEVVKTGSGMQYAVLASGDAAGAPPVNGQFVLVHYEGRLAETGALFDSSYERGEPEAFPSNGLIDGWVEALALMKPGDRWMVYVPANLAYGAEGTPGGPIPPNAPLQFEVELISVMQ